MKTGDIIYCIKTHKIAGVPCHIKGKEYIILIKHTYNINTYDISNEFKNGFSSWEQEPLIRFSLDKYFQTKQYLRKIKLNKLNENISIT